MSFDLQDALDWWDSSEHKNPRSSEYMTTFVDAARRYLRILNTDIDEWIEAEATIAKQTRELNWRRVHVSQAENLLAALGITTKDDE